MVPHSAAHLSSLVGAGNSVLGMNVSQDVSEIVVASVNISSDLFLDLEMSPYQNFHLIIKDSWFTQLRINPATAKSVTIKNCSFEGDLAISHHTPLLTISEVHVSGNLSLKTQRADSSIVIEQAQIFIGIEISGQAAASSIQMSAISGSPNLRYDGDFNRLQLEDCVLTNISFGTNAEVHSELMLNKCSVIDFDLRHLGGRGSIILNACEVDSLIIKQIIQREILISGSVIGKVELELGNVRAGTVWQCFIDTLQLTGRLNNDNTLIVERSWFEILKFQDVFNQGHISIRGVLVTATGRLCMNSSNLGKTDFINCLIAWTTFDFYNSKLTEIFISETDFPSKVSTEKTLNHRQAQLAFGQLTTASAKQGDTVRSLEYRSREIEAHYLDTRWIVWKTFRFRKVSKLFPTLNFTKFNLWLNRKSNNFGRDWGRGLLFSFIVGFVTYYLVAINTDKYEIGIPLNWDWDFFSSFLKFMNPLRFFELPDLFKVREGEDRVHLFFLAYLFDLLGRVLVAYGFYQTIQAFRRFGRA